MTWDIFLSILAATIISGTPILYATLGEILTERSGVLNLGVEGMMLMGAFTAFAVVHATGSPWLAFVAAGMAAALLASVHGLVCLVFQGNQVVSGLALTIFGSGLANYLGQPYVGLTSPGFTPLAIPLLSDIPFLGQVLFRHDPLVYLSFLLVPLFWFFIYRTRLGMELMAAGEYPAAAKAVGLKPVNLRWLGVVGGGFLVGLGGAYLSLAYTHLWTTDMSGGRGWIAVALVIFAFWRPGRAVFGAYLFGGVMALQLRLQALGVTIPSSFMTMLPYLMTVLVLMFSSLKGGDDASPAALGVNIEPEE